MVNREETKSMRCMQYGTNYKWLVSTINRYKTHIHCTVLCDIPIYLKVVFVSEKGSRS